MPGSTSQPRYEMPQVFSITVPGPLDDRTVISSVDNIDTELVAGVRYSGLLVWVEDSADTGEFYVFNGGVTNADFVSLAELISGAGVNLSIAFNFADAQNANVPIILAHNLASADLQVSMFDGFDHILVDYSIIDDNSIQINPNINIDNLRVVITFANTLFSDPPRYVTVDDLPLHKITLTNITSADSELIPGNTEIVKVSYRIVSGTPSVTAGTIAASTNFHTAELPTAVEDAVVRIDRTFLLDTTFHITVTGGVIHANIYVRENSFI